MVVLLVVVIGVFLVALFSSSHAHKSNMKYQAKQNAHEMRKTFPAEAFPPRTSSSSANELERLAKLHNNGALTDEEFEAAKKKVLS